jgi:predicted DNA-binding transcriptional regulator YafY
VVEYAIGKRNLEYSELLLLVDTVQSSRFLTEKKSKQLILKLRKLTSKPLSKRLKQQVHVTGRIKIGNESVFYNLDAIQRAIFDKRQIQFKYFDFDFNKQKALRRDGQIYTMTPLGLAYVDENYYLVVYSDHYDDIVKFRVDRMLDIKIPDTSAAKSAKFKDFDIAGYAHKTFTMFGGENTTVELIVTKWRVNQIVDRFGKDVLIYPINEDTARVCVTVQASQAFFGWVAQFGRDVKIDKPKKLAREYREYLEKILEQYA